MPLTCVEDVNVDGRASRLRLLRRAVAAERVDVVVAQQHLCVVYSFRKGRLSKNRQESDLRGVLTGKCRLMENRPIFLRK